MDILGKILGKLQIIFRDVFNDKKLIITEDTFVDDIEEWDSFANITILTAVEKEFGLKFSLRELVIIASVGDMVDLIKRKIERGY